VTISASLNDEGENVTLVPAFGSGISSAASCDGSQLELKTHARRDYDSQIAGEVLGNSIRLHILLDKVDARVALVHNFVALGLV
jgi:hypothetical protein